MILNKNCEILTINGYKDINEIVAGDFILNMSLEPRKVIHNVLIKRDCTGIIINHENWYKPFLSINNKFYVIYFVRDGFSYVKWVSDDKLCINDKLSSDKQLYLSLYNNLQPNTYDYGNLIGIYCKFGYIRDNNVEFVLEPSIATQVISIIKNIFNIMYTSFNINNNLYIVVYTSNKLYTFFNNFGINKYNKNIPTAFWYGNKNYIKGIFDALVDVDDGDNINATCTYSTLSKYMMHVFAWLTNILGYTFVNNRSGRGKCVGYTCYVITNKMNRMYIGNVLSKSDPVDVDTVYDLHVMSDSIICDNMILYNKI